jgi:hypothetical protein
MLLQQRVRLLRLMTACRWSDTEKVRWVKGGSYSADD